MGVRDAAGGIRVVGMSSDGSDHRQKVAREFASGTGYTVVRRRPGG